MQTVGTGLLPRQKPLSASPATESMPAAEAFAKALESMYAADAARRAPLEPMGELPLVPELPPLPPLMTTPSKRHRSKAVARDSSPRPKRSRKRSSKPESVVCALPLPLPPPPPAPKGPIDRWWRARTPPNVVLRTGCLEWLFEVDGGTGTLVGLESGLLESVVAAVADWSSLLALRGTCRGLKALVDWGTRPRIQQRIALWQHRSVVARRYNADKELRRNCPLVFNDCLAALASPFAARWVVTCVDAVSKSVGRCGAHGNMAAELCHGANAKRSLEELGAHLDQGVRDMIGSSWANASHKERWGPNPYDSERHAREWVQRQLERLGA